MEDLALMPAWWWAMLVFACVCFVMSHACFTGNVSLRKVGGIKFVRFYRLRMSWCVARI